MERRYRHNVNQPPSQRISGMLCPRCSGFIPISMCQILSCDSVFCPCCGLRLDINSTASARAIKALKEMEKAKRRVEEASHFDGTKR